MSGTDIQPENFRRRSFIYHKLVALGASFDEMSGAAVAFAYGSGSTEAEQAKSLGLADLSPLPRSGFKGTGTCDWLVDQGIGVPEKSNRATPREDGSLAVRLAPAEVLLLGDLGGKSDVSTRLDKAWQSAEVPPVTARGFPVPRQDSHAWFAVVGERGADLLAKLCGVDLRPGVFANNRVAQTSVARLSTIIIRHDLGTTLGYHLLPDSASAAYFWDCLTDAMSEFDGTPVGLAALRSLT